MDFIASGITPVKISVGRNSEKAVEIESTEDFYFWGKSPSSAVINIEDKSNKIGLDFVSSVTVEQSNSWKSILYSIVTLGLYCPLDYKITLLTSKELKK